MPLGKKLNISSFSLVLIGKNWREFKQMIRYNNLYEKISSIENIKLAHKNARKNKTHYAEVKMIDQNQNKYFKKIQSMFTNQTFKNAKYTKMLKSTENGKIREILKLPYYPDRIIHHCVMNIIEPIWFSTLIRDTYSSIKGRGIHDGVSRIKKALKDEANTKYCLKMDIEKFYPSINNEILKQIIRRKIKDTKLLWLLDEIIDSTSGVPIGNYLSQYFGNLYLSGLDHYAKEVLKIRYYFRYCDDIVILSDNKTNLHSVLKNIEQYTGKLKLKLKNNYQIFPVDSRGIDFLGYRFFHNYILLRKSIKKKFTLKVKMIKLKHSQMRPIEVVSSIMSYYGWLKHCNSYNLISKHINDEVIRIIQLNKQKINNNLNMGCI